MAEEVPTADDEQEDDDQDEQQDSGRETYSCGSCGARVSPTASYCGNCGGKLQWDAD